MSGFGRVEKICRGLSRLLDEGKRDFVIYPFGEQGLLTKYILNTRFAIKEKFIIDNSAVGGDEYDVRKFDSLKDTDISNLTFLIASDNEKYYTELRQSLLEYVSFENIYDLLSQSMYFDKECYYDTGYRLRDNFSMEYLNRCVGLGRLNQLVVASNAIYDMNVPGAVAECGVNRGDFAQFISRLFPDRKFYLFDTFSGFDERDLDDEEKEYSKIFRAKHGTFKNNSVDYALSKIPYINNVIVRQGYFPETAAGLENEQFAFVNLDTDLYKPIKAGLEFFYPRLNPGGYIFVHDYLSKELQGVKPAVREFCCENHIAYTLLYQECTVVIGKPL